MDSIYTFGDFASEMIAAVAPTLVAGALSRLLIRWPLVNATVGALVAYAERLFDVDGFGPPLRHCIIAGVLVFLFFEWRERAGFDAFAPFKQWRARRKEASSRES